MSPKSVFIATCMLLPLPAIAASTPDINRDGCISQDDVDCVIDIALWEASGSVKTDYPSCARVRPSVADLNKDGSVTVVDAMRLSVHIQRFELTCDCSDAPEWGDINGDCVLDVDDQMCLIEIALWDSSAAYPACAAVDYAEADLNGDGNVNVTDVQALTLAITSP